MKDLKAELEKLLVNAEDCELIARLATDKEKRETFSRIAKQLRGMADELKGEILGRSKNALGDGHAMPPNLSVVGKTSGADRPDN
jgi:SepF-like predicted cell division protein (DUF552 family)